MIKFMSQTFQDHRQNFLINNFFHRFQSRRILNDRFCSPIYRRKFQKLRVCERGFNRRGTIIILQISSTVAVVRLQRTWESKPRRPHAFLYERLKFFVNNTWLWLSKRFFQISDEKQSTSISWHRLNKSILVHHQAPVSYQFFIDNFIVPRRGIVLWKCCCYIESIVTQRSSKTGGLI